MNVLIVTSTVIEIQEFISYFNFNKIDEDYYTTTVDKNKISIFITGIGGINTAYFLTKHLVINKFDLIINSGICGSFTKKIQLGIVVNVVKEQFGDFGIDDNGNFQTVFETNLIEKNRFPFSNGILINPTDLSRFKFLKYLQSVNSITVNTASGDVTKIENMVKKFNPEIENMEGATFFYICMMEKIPFFEIRAISNFVEPRNKENWNIELAISNLNNFLIQFFETFEIND